MSKAVERCNVIYIGIPEKKQAVLQAAFKRIGYTCYAAQHGGEVIKIILERPVQCVILGPGMGHILREVRTFSTVPCLSIQCKNSVDNYGAEKIIRCDGNACTKEVIKAAVEIVTEENEGVTNFEGAVRCSGFVVNMDKFLATMNGEPVKLKPMEMRILFFMMKLRNRVVSREQLMNHVWRYESDVNTRTIDVHMMKLRQNLEHYELPFKILTLRGVGYRLADKNPMFYRE